jgi:hypothetical protein
MKIYASKRWEIHTKVLVRILQGERPLGSIEVNEMIISE